MKGAEKAAPPQSHLTSVGQKDRASAILPIGPESRRRGLGEARRRMEAWKHGSVEAGMRGALAYALEEQGLCGDWCGWERVGAPKTYEAYCRSDGFVPKRWVGW